ncbi:MAG: ATP-binding protein [Victivallaceae bacterium]|nr:ATP-binding protein [Victivallaceae bacterium]
MSRHDFSEPDKRLLAERVGFHCSNPSCGVATIGPSKIPSDKEYVGVAAHIYSASISNGPRANQKLSKEERRSIDNGIHLCNKCSTLIDKNNGDGYSAVLLKNWKKSAEAAARTRIYQNAPSSLFYNVRFENLEKNYSTALACIGLSEKNINSCPKNDEIIKEVKKKLILANKCILAGQSGSGKSLLTYQIAYQFHLEGWNIYKINKSSITNDTELVSPKNKSIIIIDDLQTIQSQLIENIFMSSYQDCMVLANYNTNIHTGDDLLRRYPNIMILLSSQIELLKGFCLQNKDEISNTLEGIGLKIQSNSYHDCIETRIKRASREATPWLFNYNLTEGWNSARYDLSLLKENDSQHFVIVTVAIFQFASLDSGVNEDKIISALKNFCSEEEWVQKVRKTIKEKCLIDEGLVRNKHYEYSRKILRLFVSDKYSRKDHNYLISLIKDILNSNSYNEGHSNILEFIMFDFKFCHYQFKRDLFFIKLGKEILAGKHKLTSAEVNKLNSLIRSDSEIIREINPGFIKNWILASKQDTAYQLGELLNTLHNAKYDTFESGYWLFERIFELIRSSEIEDYSRYSYLINRLNLFLNEHDREYATKLLAESDFSLSVSGYSAGMECFHFSNVIKDFHGISQTWADKQVANNIQGIANLFNNDFKNALRYFKELIFFYFGIISAILGFYKPSKAIKTHGRQLANFLEEQSIIDGFNDINAAGVQQYGDILIFLALYGSDKLKTISDRFNYDRLQNIFLGFSKIDHFHRALVSILHNEDSVNWRKHVTWVLLNFNYVEEIFFRWDGQLGLKRLKEGVPYEIHIGVCSDCEFELHVLKYIENIDHKLLTRIIQENDETLCKAICTNGDDHRSKFDLLIFFYQYCDSLYKDILTSEKNQNEIVKKLEKLLHGKKWEKMIAKLYIFLIKNYSTNIQKEIFEIEKRYSSVRKFNIEDYL